MVVVVVRCPAEPIQQEEKGCGARVGTVVRSQQGLGFHCIRFHNDPYSCSSQRLKSEACWGLWALDPALSMSPQLPKASPNPALHTSLRDGQRRGAVLIR